MRSSITAAAMAVTLGATVAHAEDRYQYVGGNDKAHVYLDLDKIVATPDGSEVWQLTVFPNATYSMVKSRFYCAADTATRLYGAAYDPDGTLSGPFPATLEFRIPGIPYSMDRHRAYRLHPLSESGK